MYVFLCLNQLKHAGYSSFLDLTSAVNHGSPAHVKFYDSGAQQSGPSIHFGASGVGWEKENPAWGPIARAEEFRAKNVV